jgi:hypothetical protein
MQLFIFVRYIFTTSRFPSEFLIAAFLVMSEDLKIFRYTFCRYDRMFVTQKSWAICERNITQRFKLDIKPGPVCKDAMLCGL